MKPIRIFDLDGTLADSMYYVARNVLRVLDEEKIPYTAEMMAVLTPIGYRKSAEYFSELGVPGTVDEILARMQKGLVGIYENEVPLKPGVREYLLREKKAGARLFVLTASPSEVARACMRGKGLADIFAHYYSTEDLLIPKNDPAIFSRVCAEIGCTAADVLYFDDNPVAVKTAKSFGFETYAVYDKQSPDTVAEMRAVADRFIMSFEELL